MKTENGEIRSVPTFLSGRGAGVLLHVTSLPGPFGIGDLGPAAYEWIDLLANAGQRWWQILPLGPVGEGNSPYRSYSAFAGNPLLISPDLLVRDGVLVESDVEGARLPTGNVRFKKVEQIKRRLLRIAYDRFLAGRPGVIKSAFRKFVEQQASWLADYSLFMTLRKVHSTPSWTDWPAPLLHRRPAAVRSALAEHCQTIEFENFVQFLFFRQLKSLRGYAAKRGIRLIGDLPIFVSPESADVWTHPHLFQLDRHCRPTAVAGVPPDQFSATGQCWGNPLYDWATMAKDNFAWWKARLTSALSQADLVRIDHFRGFESYWLIPAGAPTAQTGTWVKAPGVALFQALLKSDPNLPLLAEDLGVITPEVEALRDRFHLPGMRVLQFGFSSEPGNPHTPHNFVRHCFAYTGTHDNDTTASWYARLKAGQKNRLSQYAPNLPWNTDPAGCLIRLLSASTAAHVIIPMQDLLRLGRSARMNTPGRSSGNWQWRLNSFDSCRKPLAYLAQISATYERTG